jgi:hypothetical protein
MRYQVSLNRRALGVGVKEDLIAQREHRNQLGTLLSTKIAIHTNKTNQITSELSNIKQAAPNTNIDASV